MKIALVFPHQLYEQPAALAGVEQVYLIELPLFFKQYNFHKQKLILHRASMRSYADELRAQGHQLHYIQAFELDHIGDWLAKQNWPKGSLLQLSHPSDDWLLQRLKAGAKTAGFQLKIFENPNFMLSLKALDTAFGKRYFMNDFYINLRKEWNIMLDAEGKPWGGKWNLDAENRKKLPAKQAIPPEYQPLEDNYLAEAKAYVRQYFGQNLGKAEPFCYATTRTEARRALTLFLKDRMALFGPYEDAMSRRGSQLFHSMLSPYINLGLLSPQEVVSAALSAHEEENFPLNSLEGFIRQIMGWREYMRGIYEREGRKERSSNFWGFPKRPMPAVFYSGKTGLLPLDHAIQKLKSRAYNHHIERLMLLGNCFLLCEIHPDEVYRWFMEHYIDAYDWVMVPNIYGMSQFADGGLICSKPYISGSNYIRKMSDFPKGDWMAIWDGLYWRFIQKYRAVFLKNYRMAMMVRLWDKMSPEKQAKHLRIAEDWLAQLWAQNN